MNYMEKRIYLYPQVECSAQSGDRIISYYQCSVFALPFPIPPTDGIHDYRTCEGCQRNHKLIIKHLKPIVDKFPYCCRWHKNLLVNKDFNISDFKDSAEQCADKVIFTYQHIINHQNLPSWEWDVKQYLDGAVESFGKFPSNCGEPLLLSKYIDYVKQLVNGNSNIKDEVRTYVIDYFENLYNIDTKHSGNPINALVNIYNDWLNLFPFNLPFLRDTRELFRKKTPIMILPNPTIHPYTKDIRYPLITESQLIDFLAQISKDLLMELDKKIVKLPSPDLVNFYHVFIREELLFNNKMIMGNHDTEIRYTHIINQWMKNEEHFLNQFNQLNQIVLCRTKDKYPEDSYKESYDRILRFKNAIENNQQCLLIDGKNRERKLQLLFRAYWQDTDFDFNQEVNNGRGPVDFKISKGNHDKTIIEFKLASNRKLKQNLAKQVEIYKKANHTCKAIIVIFYFCEKEKVKTQKVLRCIGLSDDENIIMVDCISNKKSASNA